MRPEDKNVELHVHNYGVEACEPGHDYGPAVRGYYLFHYIFSGRGIFQADGLTYELHEGEGFLICPNVLTYYKADINFPWSYGWIGITGLHIKEFLQESGITRNNPIWRGGKDKCLETCLTNINTKGIESAKYPRTTGYAYLFLARLIEKTNLRRPAFQRKNRQESYIRTAIAYMEQNYYRKITIEMIARHVGLDRSYLGSIFKKKLTISMQDFLVNYRLSKACELLKNEDIRISDVARSVGYSDQLQFSKIFKEHMGISPLAYRGSGEPSSLPTCL